MKHLVLKETGEMFMCEVALMQLLRENKMDFTRLVGILGLYFQIRDDYCNLCQEQVTSELSALHG
jgi:geranylgeranyl diphosphate synthase type 3